MSSNYKKAVCAGSVLMLIATGFFVSPAVKADVAAIPPADIVDLAVSAVASNSAQLSWSAPGADGFVEPATSYDMRRSTSSFNSALWNTLPQVAGMPTPGQPGALQSFALTGLNPGTTYFVAVRGVDSFGVLSRAFNVVSFTTSAPPDITAPSVPANLTATAVSSGQVNLAWIASVDAVGVTGYKVFRNTVQVATSTAVSFNDAGLAPSTTYAYAVSAFDAAGNGSAASATATATTVPISNLISNVVFAPALQAIAAPSGKSFVFSILPAGQTTGGVGFTATADVNGRVAMPATVLLAPGSYDILVSSPTYLRKKLFAHNLSSNAIVALPALPAGDLDLNNTVNSLDWSLMSQRWLTADANADFNKDGIVNSIDWSIMSKNWFQTGN